MPWEPPSFAELDFSYDFNAPKPTGTLGPVMGLGEFVRSIKAPLKLNFTPWQPPDFAEKEVPVQPSLGRRVWNALDTPIANLRGNPQIFAATEAMAEPSVFHPDRWTGAAKAANFATDIISGLTSPLNLGLSATTFGALGLQKAAQASTNFAAKQGLQRVAQALEVPGRAAGYGMMLQGAEGILNPESTMAERVGGGIEAGLGYLGSRKLTKPVPTMEVLDAPPVERRLLPPARAFDEEIFSGARGTNMPYPVRSDIRTAGPSSLETIRSVDAKILMQRMQNGIATNNIEEVNTAFNELKRRNDLAKQEAAADQPVFTEEAPKLRRPLDTPNQLSEAVRQPEVIDIEPSSARTKEGGIKIGADVESLGKILGSSLYSGDITKIATKELMQNSMDAVRNLGPEGRIHVELNKDKNYISVSDNGPGMTRKELETVFTDLGSSGKRKDSSAIGGFGLAKAAPLLGGKKVEVSSIVKEGNDYFEHHFEGTPDELLKGVDIKTIKLGNTGNIQTGLYVTTHVPDNSEFYYANKFVRELLSHSGGYKGKVDLDYKAYGDTESVSFQPGSIFDEAELTPLGNEFADIDIIVPKGTRRGVAQGVRYQFLNQGMWQGAAQAGYDNAPGIPERVLVNIKPKVPEGHPEYPFTANREELRGKTYELIDKYLKENIVKPGIGERLRQLTEVWDTMTPIAVTPRKRKGVMERKGVMVSQDATFGGKKISEMSPEMIAKIKQTAEKMGLDVTSLDKPVKVETERPFVAYDVGRKYTPEEFKKVTGNKQMVDLSERINKVLHTALEVQNNPAWENKLAKTGIIFDETVLGIHIPNPKSGGKESLILINPLQIMADSTPDEAAALMVHTILHELSHIGVGAHDEKFTITLSQAERKFGAGNTVEAYGDFLQSFTGAGRGDQYTPEFQSLLQQYKEVRGRQATIEDPLRGTGIGSETKKSRGKGKADSSSGPNPAGTIAYNKLIDAIKAARPLREEQESIYTADRARKLQAAAKVSDTGEAGLYKQLAKLRGKSERVDVEPLRNHLSQQDIDALIGEIHTKLSGFKQINAKVALVKLLGGFEGHVPQNYELNLLESVFPGLKGTIELHGGLGAVSGNLRGKIAETAGLMKSLMASIDFSAPLRQGLPLMYRKEWWRALQPMFKAWADPSYYATTQQAFEQRRHYDLGRLAGLKLTEVGTDINRREEAFYSSYAERMKLPGTPKTLLDPLQLYSEGVARSNKSYVTFLNMVRADTFDNMIDDFIDAAGPNGVSEEELLNYARFVAKFINTSTGRGDLGKFEKIAMELNTAFFSPRLMAAQLTKLNPKYYEQLPKKVRYEAIKALLASAAFGITMSGLMALTFGADVSTDVTDSDFGKAKFGNTRLDNYGGQQQYVVGLARLIDDLANRRNPFPNIGRFLANKLSPIMSLVNTLLQGKDAFKPTGVGKGVYEGVTGNKVGPGEPSAEIINRLLPMISGDLYDMWKDDPNIFKIGGLGVNAALGGSVLTYPKTRPGQIRGPRGPQLPGTLRRPQ